MEVAVIFAVFGVGEVGVEVVVGETMPFEVFFVLGEVASEKGGDDDFGLGPPEFHVVPVFLYRFSFHVDEVEDAAVLFVPAVVPHPVEDGAADALQFGIAPAVTGFVEDEPGGFDSVAGGHGASIEVIDELATGSA